MTSPTNEQQRVDVLLPCPFCGSNKVSVSGQADCSYVVCGDCGAEGPFGDMTGPQAISAWNARTGVAELIEALSECVIDMEATEEFYGDHPRAQEVIAKAKAALANVGAQK